MRPTGANFFAALQFTVLSGTDLKPLTTKKLVSHTPGEENQPTKQSKHTQKNTISPQNQITERIKVALTNTRELYSSVLIQVPSTHKLKL